MDCSPTGSSVCGILQARILEWVAILFSRGSSQPRDPAPVYGIAGRFFTLWDTREAVKLNEFETFYDDINSWLKFSRIWLKAGSTFQDRIVLSTLFMSVLESASVFQILSEWVSEVAQSCLTLCSPMNCSLPGSSIHGIFQARILEWVPRRSSRPRDWTWVSRIVDRCFTVWATREVLF